MANLYSKLQKEIARGGGIAKSNQFRVVFPQLSGSFFDNLAVKPERETLEVFCNNVSLPSVQAATGQVNGYYTGSSYKYPTMKMYNDLSLSFVCDANMTALKFFHSWFDSIFQDKNQFDQDERIPDEMSHYPQRKRNRFTRLAYPDSYQTTVLIDKLEPGPRYRDQGRSMRYFLTNAYPYSIDAVPLDAGTQTLLVCSVNMFYERFEVQFEDARKNLRSDSNNIKSSRPPTSLSGALDSVKDAFSGLTDSFGGLF
tara:strand:- start:997 stop:1761 length:765 start_codon:yes stop_codon:yes gene_type:complete